MEEEIDPDEKAPKAKGKFGLIIGLVLALAGGGGAFFAVYSGLVFAPKDKQEMAKESHNEEEVVAFVPIDPMVISLGKQAKYQLRFNAQLEVVPDKAEEVAHLMPRILDVLNGYLRAVEVEKLSDPAALITIRAHMLRRVKLVTGNELVNDLLITEFVFG
ncbi:MAG: flagellar basal body-associated FliL family protein [Litoreibacter sp.]